MNKLQKQQIKAQLKTYCDRYGSQEKASKSLTEVSSATISQILNDNWELIRDEMWRNVGSQIGWSQKLWLTVDTRAMNRMNKLMEDAQAYSNVFAVCADAGTGKTVAMKHYRDNNTNAYHLCCNEYWNRKLFLSELLREMGKNPNGYTVGEMMSEAVRTLKKLDDPIIMMDEADKLSDQVLYFFITLYNQLEDHCGLVLCATDHLEKRLNRGRRLNKKGYKEIFSRMGRKFISLPAANAMDITAISIANGVTDKKAIQEVIKEAKDHNNDLRRVKRKIHAIKNR